MKPVPRMHRHWKKKKSLQLYPIPTILHKGCGHSVIWCLAPLCIYDGKTLTALQIMVRISHGQVTVFLVPCLYSLNDNEYKGYRQLQGGKDRNWEEPAMPFQCVPALGEAGRGIYPCWAAMNLLAGRCLSHGLGREAGTGCEQVVTALWSCTVLLPWEMFDMAWKWKGVG